MVVRDTYKAGDYLVVCDRCGMTRYASQCHFTWNNLFVCGPCWMPRHPQDFVHGIPDDQSVPVDRPNVPQTMGQTTILSYATKNDMTIIIPTGHGLVDRDSIGITLRDGSIHWTFVDGTPPAGTITLGSYMPGDAALGAVVYLPNQNSETYTTDTTGSGL